MTPQQIIDSLRGIFKDAIENIAQNNDVSGVCLLLLGSSSLETQTISSNGMSCTRMQRRITFNIMYILSPNLANL